MHWERHFSRNTQGVGLHSIIQIEYGQNNMKINVVRIRQGMDYTGL